ncbi:MAG: dicarboxylate/amino acid:cation symporter [Lentisphaerae bacterium]|nr:dicarboxylate/amino acid:cation symporter [Lentisphaerota bacterium]
MKLFKWYSRVPLIYLNLSAFVLGCAGGLFLYWLGGRLGGEFLNNATAILAPFGNILVNMLKMIVMPIIVCTLICGAASLPLKTFGKMGLAVCGWYFFTSLFAAIFGSAIAILFNPSLAVSHDKLVDESLRSRAAEMAVQSGQSGNAFLDIIYSLFSNPFEALAQGKFLPVIVFSILFGLAARVILDIANEKKDLGTQKQIQNILDLFDAFQKIIFKIVDWVLKYFPIGVFALTAFCFAKFGVALFQSYLQVAGCVICGILLMITVCYPLAIAIICRENPFPILWKLREPILTAFVTRSSAATLPVSMKTSTENLKVRKELSGFTLSLGSTVNMDGVCIHLPVFAVLAANLFGFEMSMNQILLMVLGVVFASIGAGGIPGGSVFLLFLVLSGFNLTREQTSIIVALALGINPLLDMFETACNVAGDNIGTYVVGRKMNMIDAEDCQKQ